ncbi:Hypothetical predicted protein [Drosophila guanche]|uniref:Uncharacterized protein n=1 Tax=Drosophila guanche TaxID=7266 RepID=A0A3B0K094_DROGU|nr:Hypothetical predicted protein [Drosophila guanche]
MTMTPTLNATATTTATDMTAHDPGLGLGGAYPKRLNDQYQLLIQQRQIMTLYDYYLYQRSETISGNGSSHGGTSIATSSI